MKAIIRSLRKDEVIDKVNDVRLNRRFVETDDEEEAGLLFSQIFNVYHKTVFDTVDRRRWKHPDTVVDPDEITSDTFIKAFKKTNRRAREIGRVVGSSREKPDD